MRPTNREMGAAGRIKGALRKASLFKNGANQAVRLPQEFRFPDEVTEVLIRKEGNDLVLSPARPEWRSFFSSKVEVPENFLADRGDLPPQRRDPL